MGQLGEVFSKKITPPLIDIYWETLSGLAVESFEFCCRWYIANGEHFPKPGQIRQALAHKPRPSLVPQLEHQYPEWLRLVNLLFWVWMAQEISSGKRKTAKDGIYPYTIPMAEIRKRRELCRSLAEDFEMLEREKDPSANREWLKEQFNNLMAMVPVSNPA